MTVRMGITTFVKRASRHIGAIKRNAISVAGIYVLPRSTKTGSHQMAGNTPVKIAASNCPIWRIDPVAITACSWMDAVTG